MDSTTNHKITLPEASAMTKRYRDSISSGQTIGLFFGKKAMKDILAQTGCAGIRLYYGITDAGAKQIVATGVNAAGNDLYTGVLEDRAIPCPQECSTPNPLNSNVTG